MTTPTPATIASTRGSIAIALAPPGTERPSRSSITGASKPSSAHVRPMPSVKAVTQMTQASAMSMRTTSRCRAPSASRTATSFCRRVERSSTRNARFAQMMTSTIAAAAVTATRIGRTCATYC